MADPAWWDGEPTNIEAAAADALLWLDLLARNASVLRMPPADYINLTDCRAALAKFSEPSAPNPQPPASTESPARGGRQ